MTQLLSLGLDGAAWHKLDRMMADGKLPNLQRMVEEGTRAPLETVLPPVTCPAWRCSTSGKDPGQVGVFWWLNLDRATGRITSPTADSFDTADVWDYLSEEGDRCAVLNVPMTYPPSEVDGIMVSGFGAPFEIDLDADSMTYPPELQDRLEAEYDWQVGIDDVNDPGGVEEALDLIRSRFELLLDTLEEGDFDYVHLTVFYINVLQHHFGDGPETERGWKLIDEYLGKLPDDLTKIVYSDHGHSHIERTFVINKYLIDNGYLSIESRAGDDVTGGIYSLLKQIGVSPRTAGALARRALPESLYERIVQSGYPIPTFELANRVNWEESDAVALSQGPIYINRDRVGDYERFRDDLKSELESISVEGESPFDSVAYAEDVYSGDHLDEAPDLMLVAADEWEVYGGVTPSVVERQATSWTSGNHPIGMLLAHGPDVNAGELSTRSILDIAPTVLQYLDAAVPTDMNGEPFEEPFRDGLPERRTREPIDSEGRLDATQDEDLERRLEDLGYLE